MGIFSPPDFEQLRGRGDWPRLIHWSLYDRDPEASRAARDVLREDPAHVVEYLYETALWTQQHGVGRHKRPPRHGVMLLNEATRALKRVGAPAVPPLVEAVRLYDRYGEPDDDMRYLMYCLVFEVLEKIGRPSLAGLRSLAESPDELAATFAREALESLEDRGVTEERPPRAAPPRRGDTAGGQVRRPA